ncbi:MAG: nitroreductase [Micavibrio sp.]
MSDVIAGRRDPALLEYLARRRSVPLRDLCEPAPDRAQIEILLKTAMRVPDHGKLFPWHFIVFEGEARTRIGEIMKKAFIKRDPDAPAEKVTQEQEKFLRAPLVIAVISRIRPAKHPRWEQILSAGAACQTLCLTANAMGFGANWLTEWPAYNQDVKAALGLDARDQIAGFIYIGSIARQPEDRPRPDPALLATWWQGPETPLNRGDSYDKNEFKLPE